MRLFVALDIDEPIRQKLQTFVEGVSRYAPEIRFVSPQTFHVTLKFLGEIGQVDAVRAALAEVQGPQFSVEFRGYGFFPGPRNARVFWAGIHAGPELKTLAGRVDETLSRLGFERERGPLQPHLTLARSGSGRPRPMREDKSNSKFALLQERLSKLAEPEFGTMTAREFYLYESKLSSSGARYTKLQAYPLA